MLAGAGGGVRAGAGVLGLDSVKLFLSKANNRKHTRAEFFAMILYAYAVEYQYTLRFQQSVPTAVRMAGHSFGDISFDLEKIKVTAELKLAAADTRSEQFPLRHDCIIFRRNHSIEICVNLASVFYMCSDDI